LRRLLPFASSRFARLRHATASTSPAISTSSPAIAGKGPSPRGRELTPSRGSGATTNVRSRSLSGYAAPRLRAKASSAGPALTPGFNAPARLSAWFSRSSRPVSRSLNIALVIALYEPIGSHHCGEMNANGPANPLGVTPTTVKSVPLMRTTLPRNAGSRLRRCQTE
jgi:hypothetical protein